MSSPIVPVPNTQVRYFGLAVCERLGLDPAIVSDKIDWKVTEEDLAPVTFTVYLPADEVLAMFNGAAPIVRRSRG